MKTLTKILKWTFWLIVALVLALVVALEVALTNISQKTPEQQEAEQEAEREANAAIAQITYYVKGNLRNPDSFEIRQLLITTDGTLCMTYAAQNGFGGTNVEHIASENSLLVPYETYCNGKSGKDWTLSAQYNHG